MPNVKDKMTGNVVKSKFQPKCIHLQDRIPGPLVPLRGTTCRLFEVSAPLRSGVISVPGSGCVTEPV